MINTSSSVPGCREFRQKLPAGESLDGLDDLMSRGVIASYSREGNDLVVYGRAANAQAQVAALHLQKAPRGSTGVVAKLRDLFIPPKDARAPEYIRYRLWSLGTAVCAGAIGFMNSYVTLNAINVAFTHRENVAIATVANDYIQKFASMGASALAGKGDIDPRACFLASSMIAAGNSIATLAVLSVFPHAYVPLLATISGLGALATTIGNSAGTNIANHMAIGNNKGLVGARNSNQDLLAGLMGAPLALGLEKLAHLVGIPPFAAVVGVCGAGMALCTWQAARAIHLNRLTKQGLDKIADQALKDGTVPQAPQASLGSTLHGLLVGNPDPSTVQVADRLDEVAPPNQATALFAASPSQYLANVVDGKPEIGLRPKTDLPTLVRAWMHARLMDDAMHTLLWPTLQKLWPDTCGPKLSDLVDRVLPDGASIAGTMGDRGWNPNAAGMRLPTIDAVWPARQGAPQPLTMDGFKALMQKPDEATLRSLLTV